MRAPKGWGLIGCLLTTLLLPGSAPSVPADPPAVAGRETGSPEEVSRLLTEALTAYQSGNLRAAQQAFEAIATKAAATRPELLVAAAGLNRLGNDYYERGQLEKALAAHTRAFHLFEKHGAPREIAQSLSNLGADYENLGQYAVALGCHRRALGMLEKLGTSHDIAQSLNNLGNLYDSLGRFAAALECHHRALDRRQKLGDPQDTAVSLQNLGAVYYHLGQLGAARDYYRLALGLFRRANDPMGIAQSLNNLAVVHEKLDQFAEALEAHRQALSLNEKLGRPQQVAHSLNNRGVLFHRMGRKSEALEQFQRAQGLLEQLGNPQEIGDGLMNLGAVHESLGHLAEALDFYQRARAIYAKLGNPQDIANSLSNIGTIYSLQGRTQEAEPIYAQSLRQYERITDQVVDPAQVGAFQEVNQSSLYLRYAALLLRLQRPAAALAMTERGRAQGLARQAIRNRVDWSVYLRRADAGQLRASDAEWRRAGKLLGALSSAEPSDPEEKKAWQQQMEAARQRYDRARYRRSLLWSTLLARYPEYRRLQGQQSPMAAQLTQLADRHPDTLFLEWGVLDDRSTLLFALSRKEGLKAFLLPVGVQQLKRLRREWRESIRTESLVERQLAAALYHSLLGPVEQAGLLRPGRFTRLVLVPDGPLLDLPFAALVDRAGKRLIERCAISSTTSLGMLTWPANPRQPTASLLYAADPTGKGGERLQNASRRGFKPLPYAREEARRVASQYPGADGLAGAAAREAEVKRRMGRYALLHFATHGKLDGQEGLRSYLLLAPEPRESLEDGRLEAREIMEQPVTARLAVLSACHTGQGQQSGGEGLLGLAWAFHAAGCPSVVASQWAVTDAATASLIDAFYRNLKQGKRKDTALQAAMLAVRKQRAHPLYWAAFQVMGDTRSLSLPSRTRRRFLSPR